MLISDTSQSLVPNGAAGTGECLGITELQQGMPDSLALCAAAEQIKDDKSVGVGTRARDPTGGLTGVMSASSAP